MRSPRKTDAAFKYKGVVLAVVFLSVLAGLKLGGMCVAMKVICCYTVDVQSTLS